MGERYISYVINSDNLRTVAFLGGNPRGNFPRSSRREERKRMNPTLKCTDATHSWANKVGDVRRDAPCAYIDGDAEGPFSLSRCGLVASAGISFAVVCASQAPVDAPGPYWCRCIRLLSLAHLPAPFFGTRFTNPCQHGHALVNLNRSMDTALKIGSIAEHPAVGALLVVPKIYLRSEVSYTRVVVAYVEKTRPWKIRCKIDKPRLAVAGYR